MLIAEDLLLLLTDDRTGKLVASTLQVDVALGGGVLVELALAQRVDVDGGGRLVVTNGGPTGDEILDEALAALPRKQGKKPKHVVLGLGKGLRARLHARLAERGLLHEETGKILGLVPTHRWPAADATHEDSVRAAIVEALRAGATTDERISALVALLHAVRAVDKVAGAKGLDESAKQIAEGDWASEAVRRAVEELLAAVLAATSATVVTVGS